MNDEITGAELANEMSRYVNTIGGSDKENDALVEAIMRDHRTLQQGVGRFVIKLIEAWSNAYEAGHHDLRNEAICKFANTCMKNTDVRDRALPFI